LVVAYPTSIWRLVGGNPVTVSSRSLSAENLNS